MQNSYWPVCLAFVEGMLVTAATTGLSSMKCPASAQGKMRARNGSGLTSWAQEGGVSRENAPSPKFALF